MRYVVVLEFSLNLPCPSDKLFEKVTDFENFNKYIPIQLENVRILKKNDDQIFTEEKIRSVNVLKEGFIQTSVHIVKENKIETKILSGPAKGTTIESLYQNSDVGTRVSVKINLKLNLKYKLFTILVKKEYKKMLTGILYKMNTSIMEEENK